MGDALDKLSAPFRRVRQVLDNEWDGFSTAELILLIIRATGEDVGEVLEDARYKWRHNLFPPPEKGV